MNPTKDPSVQPTVQPTAIPSEYPTERPTVLIQDDAASDHDTDWYHRDFVSASFIELCIVLVVIILIVIAACTVGVCFYRTRRNRRDINHIVHPEPKVASNGAEPKENVVAVHEQEAHYSLIDIEGTGISGQSNGRTAGAVDDETEMAVLPVEEDQDSE